MFTIRVRPFYVIGVLTISAGLASPSHAGSDAPERWWTPSTAMEDVTPQEIEDALKGLRAVTEVLLDPARNPSDAKSKLADALSKIFALEERRPFARIETRPFAPTYHYVFDPILQAEDGGQAIAKLTKYTMMRLVEDGSAEAWSPLLRGFGTELVASRLLAAAKWLVYGVNSERGGSRWDVIFEDWWAEVKSIAFDPTALREPRLREVVKDAEAQLIEKLGRVKAANHGNGRPGPQKIALILGANAGLITPDTEPWLQGRLIAMANELRKVGVQKLAVIGLGYRSPREAGHNGPRFQLELIHPRWTQKIPTRSRLRNALDWKMSRRTPFWKQ